MIAGIRTRASKDLHHNGAMKRSRARLTAGGRRFARVFFALDRGAGEARARDSAFPSFHSTRDGLQLIAVATARVGGEGWGR